MRQGGALIGQVVTPENSPVGGADVLLYGNGKQLSRSKTDRSGYFAFTGVRSGVYELKTAKCSAAYRVWNQGTAPPASQPSVLLVAGAGPVRGQGGVGAFLTHPLVLAAIVATAIAVPIAVHNSQRGPSSP